MVSKQLQLLGEVVPSLRRAAFLGSTEDPATTLFVGQAREAAQALAMQAKLIRSARDAALALDNMERVRAQAVVVQPLFATSQSGPLVGMLAKRRLPAVTAQRSFAVAGGLMAFGFSRSELSSRTASFVDRILKGASPASLPVEEPTTYELVFNLATATAKAMDIEISQVLLLHANEVIQ
jgi:putative ABC transport system substrate-binding protein